MVKLGSKVKDVVTGITGMATARIEYVFGDPQIRIELVVDGKPVEVWYAENRVELLEEPASSSTA